MLAKNAHRRSAGGSCIAALVAAGALFGFADARAGFVGLTWTAPGDDGSIGTASTYELRYRTVGVTGVDTTSWWNAATSVPSVPAPRIAGTKEAFTVAGLDSGQTYYFIIRTSDEIPNWSAFSDLSVKVARETFTLATPQQFQALATPSSVTLSWSALAPDAGSESRMYRKGPGELSPRLLRALPITATSWTDTTVSPGLSYEYRLATFGGGQEGAPAIAGVTLPGVAAQIAETDIHGFPNPAHDNVTFRFAVGTGGTVRTRITVFDLMGHKICELVDGDLPPGEHSVSWDCRSTWGRAVAPGMYNVVLESPSGRSVEHLAILP
ncbi:MAG: hypothetical protein E6K76_00335 [Candidatus Eisenbacteria bacterium]|uniref:Fibronectin type-III domain-containing protein n=1 Tax=Eiseniibacteriota bacterium TaxID=2212470 RepID=A0A538TBI1_UNCEI|nr:MAG: hypothetical protein E6K76_00335 [Candidatus Eisenbacteria bacterium]